MYIDKYYSRVNTLQILFQIGDKQNMKILSVYAEILALISRMNHGCNGKLCHASYLEVATYLHFLFTHFPSISVIDYIVS
jgi:hypothetical protein